MNKIHNMTDEEASEEVERQLIELRKEARSGSSDFFHAVRNAGRGFVNAKGKDPQNEGAKLALHLLSDEPLGKSERIMLAELVRGEWRQRAGKRPQTSFQQKEKIIAELRELVKSGWKKTAAKHEIANKHNVIVRTIEKYETEVKEREEAVAKAQAKMKQSAHPAS